MSIKAAIVPLDSTKPIGKYSPGVAVGMDSCSQLVFVSGQVASDSLGKVIAPNDPSGQAEYVFEKIASILSAAGGNLSHLVNLVIYLTDMRNFDLVSEVRNRILSDPAPASTLVQVAALAIPEHLVEISGIAVVPLLNSDV